MKAIPFRLFLLAHPQSDSANGLAQELMRRFVDPPASGGLRLPVFLTPDRGDGLPPAWDGEEGINLDASAHTLVVVLADAVMAQTIDDGTGAEWTAFLEEGIRRAQSGAGHMVFGITVGKGGYLLSDRRHMVGVAERPEDPNAGESPEDFQKRSRSWLSNAADTAALHIAIRAIQLLEPRAQPVQPGSGKRLPVQLFLSHAKADLKPDEVDPVRDVENAIKELPIEHWFDAQDIPPAEEFERVIQEGVRDCSIVVAFLTDQYASRFYCQWEILTAKQLGVPILVVDALAEGEPRNFPYLGNVPTLHWNGADRSQAAKRIVYRAVREALRFMHNRACLRAHLGVTASAGQPARIVLASAPEALTLNWHAEDRDAAALKPVFFYPDPPLPKHELAILKSLRGEAEFVTPLTQVAGGLRSDRPRTIAVSISESGELARYGLSPLHEQTLSDEMHLYLLVAGLRIAYGGAMQADFQRSTNFTGRLFDLVRGYSPLARDAGVALAPILNVPPWPVWLKYDQRIKQQFSRVGELLKADRPALSEVPESDAELFPADKSFKELPDTPPRRLAWARGLTRMRSQMTQLADARVVIGGKLSGFSGLYPGVVEEAWMSIIAQKPLYLVGAFGGAARAVIDLLQGRDRPEVRQPAFADPKSKASPVTVESLLQLAQERTLTVVTKDTVLDNPPDLTGKLIHPDRMANDLQAAGQKGLAAALHNGLTDEENKELFRYTDPPRIAELILRGLARLKLPTSP